MPDFFCFLLIPTVFIFIGVMGYLSYLKEKKRTEDFAAWAEQRGWDFEPGRTKSWHRKYSQFAWFNSGHSQRAHNLLHGLLTIKNQAIPCTLGDFVYKRTSGSGKKRKTTTYRFSFALIELPLTSCPEIVVRPEGFFDTLSSLIGFDDIDFESEEFSRKFHVKSTDKRFAYDLLHPQMMEFMLETPPMTFEVERGVFCLKSGNKCWQVSELDYHVNWCKQWLDLWPRHLLADLQSR